MTGARRAAKWIALAVAMAAIVGCFLALRHASANGASLALQRGLRVVVVAASLAAWFISQSLIGSRQLKAGGIADGVHELTAPLNRHLLEHPRLANGVLIVSSGFIDIFGLFLIGAAIFGPSLRPFLALLILFAMRQACQSLVALPAPPGMIWRHPGFPSLLVTYGVANDFFFSGHTAIAVLGAIEVARLCPWWLGLVAGIVALLEAGTVLVLRAHYTMDIAAAAAAAFCAAELTSLIGGL